MKNILLLCACLWALATPLRAAVAPPADIVVVRIYEANSITAFITRGAGKSEKVEFNSGVTDKNMKLAGEGYYQICQQLYQQGYTLQSTITAPWGAGAYHTLLFVKAQ